MILKEIFQYREMIYSLVRRDLVGKYKKSVLGFLWTMVEPLCQLVIYTIVFTYILPMGVENYYIHLFVALVPWNFFSQCLTGGSTVIVNQQDMIKKIYFPREVLVIAHVTSQFVSLALSLIVVFAVVLFSGIGFSLRALVWLPAVMLIEYVLCIGVVFFSSAVTVYLRDMQMILGLVSMALMYASPIIYPISYIPEQVLPWYMLNPVTAVIVAYREILFERKVPDAANLGIAALLSLLIMLLGWLVFNRLKRHFVEEL